MNHLRKKLSVIMESGASAGRAYSERIVVSAVKTKQLLMSCSLHYLSLHDKSESKHKKQERRSRGCRNFIECGGLCWSWCETYCRCG